MLPIGGGAKGAEPPPGSGARPSDDVAKHPILGTRWLARVKAGEHRALEEPEITELFEAVRPGCSGTLEMAELLAVAKQALPPAIARSVQAALLVMESADDKHVDTAQFLQAMRLGSSGGAAALAAQMRGREVVPEEQPAIPKEDLLEYLSVRQNLLGRLRQLPFYLCFFVLSFSLSLLHFGQSSAYQLVTATGQALPLEEWERAHPTALLSWLATRAEAKQLARFSDVFGGVRVRRFHSLEDASEPRALCSKNSFGDAFGLVFSGYGVGEPRVCEEDAVDGREWLLWPLASGDAQYTDALTRVQNWWTAPAGSTTLLDGPRQVEVRALAQNLRLNFFVLFRVNLQTPRAGLTKLERDIVALDASPTWLGAWQGKPVWEGEVIVKLLDVVFLWMCLVLAMLRFGLFLQAWKHKGARSALMHEATFAHCLDWLIALSGFAVAFEYAYACGLTDGLHRLTLVLSSTGLAAGAPLSTSALEGLLAEEGLTLAAYHGNLDAATEQAMALARASEVGRIFAVVLCLATCLRLFDSLRVSRRVEKLLGAAVVALKELRPLFVAAAVLLTTFATAGHAIFGARSELFHTWTLSLHSTTLLALGFAPEATTAQELREQGGVLGTIWLTSLAAAAVLLLFGVAVATLAGAYGDACAAAKGKPPSAFHEAFGVFGGEELRRLCALAVEEAEEGAAEVAVDELRKAYGLLDEAHVLTLAEGLQAEYITPSRLARELQRRRGGTATSGSERLHLRAVLERALAARPPAAAGEDITTEDAVRVCGRADANIRELWLVLGGLEESARILEDHVRRGKSENRGADAKHESPSRDDYRSPGGGSDPVRAILPLGPSRGDALHLEDVDDIIMPTGPTSRSQDRQLVAQAPTAAGKRPRAPESPEPEPPTTLVDSAEAKRAAELLKDRMNTAALAQGTRLQHLEEAINMLARRIQLVMNKDGTTIDVHNLDALEVKVRKLVDLLGPLFKANIDLERESVMRGTTVPASWANGGSVFTKFHDDFKALGVD